MIFFVENILFLKGQRKTTVSQNIFAGHDDSPKIVKKKKN